MAQAPGPMTHQLLKERQWIKSLFAIPGLNDLGDHGHLEVPWLLNARTPVYR